MKLKKVYFLCSPNLGILDSWSPVIYKLKEKGLKVICIIPKIGTVYSLSNQKALKNIFLSIFDQVIFRTHSDHWVAERYPFKIISDYTLTNFRSASITILSLFERHSFVGV